MKIEKFEISLFAAIKAYTHPAPERPKMDKSEKKGGWFPVKFYKLGIIEKNFRV